VREFRDVAVKTDLTVTLTPSAGARNTQTLLSGIEVRIEGDN